MITPSALTQNNLQPLCARQFFTPAETKWSLFYLINAGHLSLRYSCWLVDFDIFEETLLYDDENLAEIDDPWDYYFRHTPCAISDTVV